MTIVKCKYSNCRYLHDSKELDVDDAIKQGSQYFHKDCSQTKIEIKEIIDLFSTKINPNPVYSQLQSVIKNIVFTKGLGSNLLLFGLKYYIEHKIPLNYPQGLYYVVQNKAVVEAYNKEKAKHIKQKIDSQAMIEYSDDNFRDFGYTSQKNKTIEDVLR